MPDQSKINFEIAKELERFIGFGEGIVKRTPNAVANAGIWLMVEQMKKRIAELCKRPQDEAASIGAGNNLLAGNVACRNLAVKP